MRADNSDGHNAELVKMDDGSPDIVDKGKSIHVHTRREFLKLSAAAAAAVAVGSNLLYGCGNDESTPNGASANTAESPTAGVAAFLVKSGDPWVSLRASRDNLYSVWVDKGQKQCARAYDLDYYMLVNDNKPEVAIAQMESEAQKGVKMFTVSTPGPGPIPTLAEICNANKAALVSNWDHPDWWLPISGGEYFVCFLIPPQVEPAYKIAKYLFTQMGGEGGFVHLAGTPGGTCDWTRTIGIDMALKEFPNIKLLARQATGWSRVKSRPVMDDFIVKFGDQIKGVFGQNDDVAIGGMNALDAVGMSVPIVGVDGNPETFELIEQGKMAGTVTNFPTYIAGWSCAIAYDFMNGYKFSPVECALHWGCQVIDKTNVAQAMAKFYPDDETQISFDWRKMSRVLHPDDWDPQNEITCIKWEEFWAPREKPAGYEIPKVYTDAVAAGERERVDQMYADHYKMKIMEGVPEVQI